MKKETQIVINAKCYEEYKKAMKEYLDGPRTEHRLRTCTAWVYETKNYWILKSYNTVVAVTSKDTGVCYDVLRRVYGYTATSAQHIAKFTHDYHTTDYKWCAPKLVAR